MTITTRPSRSGPSLLGGSIDVPVNPCLHDTPLTVEPWAGEPGTVGKVALVGAGKMGLPLAAQFASHRLFRLDQNYGCLNIIDYFPDLAVVRLLNGGVNGAAGAGK